MSHGVKKVAAVGVGVIGGGWIARFLLNGIDVAVFDPAPGAAAAAEAMIANAERAYRKMTLAPWPARGELTFHATIAEAVRDADYVQESVPERLDLKHRVLAEIVAAAPASTPIGSSTSGFKPSELQEGVATPERIFVAHPFNPVYLVPVVEIVPSPANDLAIIGRAEAFLTAMGMKPLRVRKEIDANIADRLLEAVWREGLWLIHDGVATTQEIDDAIRFGFGLRWAQMGLFETYRIAGGEAGMKHFLGQFGPALKWPWTKLMDVPDLDDALVETIAGQSDAQSGMHSIRELERIRDDNLVGILLALKANGWGAGELLKDWEGRLYQGAHAGARDAGLVAGEPLRLHETRVRDDWADYNGHMTESRYLQVFGDATDAVLAFIGMDAAYLASGASVYTVETHIRHLAEVAVGVPIAVETQLLGHDDKRMRLAHTMRRAADGEVLATAEHMLMHVDTHASKASPFGARLAARLGEIAVSQADLPVPEWAGRAIRSIG
jgi:carnitine 3-dehydrogenase